MQTKKNEPLKEKVIVGDPHEGIKFKFEDVKSAVQGLLEEIEGDIKYWKEEMEEYEEKSLNAKTDNEREEYTKYWEIAEQVHRVLKNRIKNLIKKWFPDVCEVDEKNE